MILLKFQKPEYIHLGGDEVYGHMDSRGLNNTCYTNSGKQLNDFLVELAEFCVQQESQNSGPTRYWQIGKYRKVPERQGLSTGIMHAQKDIMTMQVFCGVQRI